VPKEKGKKKRKNITPVTRSILLPPVTRFGHLTIRARNPANRFDYARQICEVYQTVTTAEKTFWDNLNEYDSSGEEYTEYNPENPNGDL
jgi:hypothetical protein